MMHVKVGVALNHELLMSLIINNCLSKVNISWICCWPSKKNTSTKKDRYVPTVFLCCVKHKAFYTTVLSAQVPVGFSEVKRLCIKFLDYTLT